MSKAEAGRLGSLQRSENLRKTYTNNPNLCACCSQPLPYEKKRNKFCSHSCSASYNNKKIATYVGCLNCDTPVKQPRKFCNHKCQREYQYNTETKPKIIQGMVSDRLVLKKFIIKERGDGCEECSLVEWNGVKLSLELDHVDGNANNNLPSNLRILCPNCHSITPTWKGRNKGNGRASRKISLS